MDNLEKEEAGAINRLATVLKILHAYSKACPDQDNKLDVGIVAMNGCVFIETHFTYFEDKFLDELSAAGMAHNIHYKVYIDTDPMGKPILKIKLQ